MIDFNEIQIEDKSLFDRFISQGICENSEFTFTNLFIWRHAYRFRYAVLADHLCVIGHYRGKMPLLFPPIGPGNDQYPKAMEMLKNYFSKVGTPFVMKAVTADQKSLLEHAMTDRITFKEDRNNYDYVYCTKDLIELEGKKYRQKRNHINKFKASYDYTFEPIDTTNIDACLETAVDWALQRSGDEGIQEEKRAILEMFENFEALSIKGAALRVGGTIQAFTLGEQLNHNTAVIHIEKANTDYHGSYTAINQMFAQHYLQEFSYINREEDMGIPGLRKAKESYHPTKMIVKYTGFFV